MYKVLSYVAAEHVTKGKGKAHSRISHEGPEWK